MTIPKFMLATCLCALMLLVMTGSGTTSAQTQTTITLPDAELNWGDSSIIEAHSDCGADWCGNVVFTLTFDPSVIEVQSVEIGPYLGDQHVEIIDVDNAAGTVSFRATAIQSPTPTADNVLFRLNVQSVGIGQSALEITDLELKDSTDAVLAATAVSGSVTVSLDVDDLLGVLSTFDWRIVFVSERDANPEIYVMNADGSNQTRLTEEDARDDMPVWSPSGSPAIGANTGVATIPTVGVDGIAGTTIAGAATATTTTTGGGGGGGNNRDDGDTPERIEVTENLIREKMQGAELQTKQDAVSLPKIQRIVDSLQDDGYIDSWSNRIQVDDGFIVEGNHRYIAGRIMGFEWPSRAGNLPTSVRNRPTISWQDIEIDSVDWGY
jgi:hypothetical protein